MQVELAGQNVLLAASVLKNLFGELSAIAIGDHPSDNLWAEDIDSNVKVEISPLGWPKQHGDVPAPESVGGGNEQLMFLVSRMGAST